ncbi:hypothetical protein ACIBEJ_48710 [Nonomuraea sp. NPDC050790]|uniref:hypothetical protein n=1 Tax=Nonomuraea sp. NPDC050790 TaxID=3364371 RepID=UPI003792EF02
MRIRAREPLQVYWNYQVHHLAEDEVVKGGLAEHLADDPRVEVLDGTEATGGTIAEILAWVGDDTDRAAQAREAEAGREKSRSTLLAKLDEIINAD